MKRLMLAGGLSLPVTFFLFFVMANLVNTEKKLVKSDDSENFINFLRTTSTRSVESRKRTLPKKPPEPKAPPQMPKMAIKAASNAPAPKMAMNVPLLSSPLGFGGGPYMGGGTAGGAGQGDSDVIPLVRIEPQYPRKAAMSGKEGYVQLKFDITETGAVADVTVIKAKPRGLFEREAKRALYKWKYRPQLVDGKALRRKGLLVQLDFKLRR